MSIRKSDRIISVEHVSKYFGEKAVLNDVNLQVRKGEFVTILGPSGCGKTTLLRLIAGFQTASEGIITIAGKEITQTPPHKRPVNTVFQKYALFPHLNVFNNIASYKFSEMRFNLRGYDSRYSDVYMNGIQLNDALTGYSPWSLWSGLNDATRNQEVTSGLNMGEIGIGSISGTTNINTRPSQMRKGFRASLVNGNSTYRFRGMVTYASGPQDNGWSYALSVSTRQGGNSYVHGVYYNAFGYFAAIEKQFNEQHRLALTVLGAPTERGTHKTVPHFGSDSCTPQSR